jgi:hypothetical protein
MGVPASEVGYISDTTERGDREVQKKHVVALEGGEEDFVRLGLNPGLHDEMASTVGVSHVSYLKWI